MEMQTDVTVDVLEIDDVRWFVEVAAINMLTDELKRPELINIDHLYNLTYKVMMDKTAFVAKKNGVCIGALGAILVPNMFNPTMSTLAELVWYVLPEYRHTKAGSMLLDKLEDKGQEVANDTTMSLLPSSGEAVERSLARRGFNLEEFGFRKRNT